MAPKIKVHNTGLYIKHLLARNNLKTYFKTFILQYTWNFPICESWTQTCMPMRRMCCLCLYKAWTPGWMVSRVRPRMSSTFFRVIKYLDIIINKLNFLTQHNSKIELIVPEELGGVLLPFQKKSLCFWECRKPSTCHESTVLQSIRQSWTWECVLYNN